MHVASHAVSIGEYTRPRALTPFCLWFKRHVSGSTPAVGSPRRPRQKAFQCRSKILCSLASPPADNPFAAVVYTATRSRVQDRGHWVHRLNCSFGERQVRQIVLLFYINSHTFSPKLGNLISLYDSRRWSGRPCLRRLSSLRWHQ